jgi:hypothetical protein
VITLPGRDIQGYIQRKQAGLYALLQNWAGQMEGYAKEHATWTDRTSHARQSLHGGVDVRGDQFVLYLSHGVEYGLWLEIAHAGNYAIVGPTVDVHIERMKIVEMWN